MPSWKSVVPALLALALTGCYKDTAQATLGGVAEAACRGNVDQLRSLLMGDALAEFGNAAGAERICKAAQPAQGQRVKLEDRLQAETQDPSGRAAWRLYEIKVTENRVTLVTALAGCEVTWKFQQISQQCTSTGGPYPTPICHSEYGWVDYEACKISSLKAD